MKKEGKKTSHVIQGSICSSVAAMEEKPAPGQKSKSEEGQNQT